MGAEQSTEQKRKDDAKYQAMITKALEQQRKTYEEKCKQLLAEQEKIKKTQSLNKRTVPQNNTTCTGIELNSTLLYPNLQQVSNLQTQASSSSTYNHVHSNLQPNQHRSILLPVPNNMQVPQTVHHNFPQNVRATQATTSWSTNSQNQNMTPSNASVGCQPTAPSAPTAPMLSKQQTVQQKPNQNRKAKKDGAYLCPTCKVDYFDTIIYQCQQGHSSCDECKKKAAKCGICNSTITKTRNIELERLIANLPKNNVKNTEKVNCPNKSDGCSLTFKPENLQAHLKDCLFREMECPLASAKYSLCSWRGKINQMISHFSECHPNNTGACVDKEISFNRLTNKYVIHHSAIGNFNFLVHVKLDEETQTIFMAVQLIGSLHSASRWTYEFHVYDKTKPRRKFVYVDACLPNSIPFSDISKEHKCAALPLQYALSFFQDNNVTYKFYLKRQESLRGPNQRAKNAGNTPGEATAETK